MPNNKKIRCLIALHSTQFRKLKTKTLKTEFSYACSLRSKRFRGFFRPFEAFFPFWRRENWGERNTEGAGRGRGGEKRKRFSVPPFSSPLLALFCARPNFRAFIKQRGLQTCEKSYGNACYAGYSREEGLPYERDGDALRKSRVKPQRRPVWAWPRLYLSPKGDPAETDNQIRAMVI